MVKTGRGLKTKKQTVEISKDYYNITKFRHENEVDVFSSIGTVYSIQNINGAIKTNLFYKIFPISFGSGKNKKNFLITDAKETKNIGTNRLYLRPLKVPTKIEEEPFVEFFSDHWPEKNILKEICKENAIPTTEIDPTGKRECSVDELIFNIMERQQSNPFIFAETSGVVEEELAKLKPEDWHKIVTEYLTEGLPKDPLIELIYKSDLMEPNPALIRPAHYQPYNSHEIIFTNSKTGKSMTSKKTGIQVDSARPANLLGFATAKEKVEGSLNKQTKQLTTDEIQEETSDEIFGALSNYMETGECETRKGKAKVNVQGYAGLRWQGNPKPKKEHTETIDTDFFGEEEKLKYLYQNFSDCLGIISRNNTAFGGRIAQIVFRSDLKQIKASANQEENTKQIKLLPLRQLQQNQAVVSSVLRKARNAFTELYHDDKIVEWLNKGFNKSYDEALRKIVKQVKLLNLQEFIDGHRDLASRHTRGKALKCACVDSALELANETVDKQELLNLGNEYLNQIEEENLKSLSNLVSTASKESTIKEYLLEAFNELPEHLKYVIKAMKETYDSQGTEESSLEALKTIFPTKSQIDLGAERIIQRTIKNMTRTNNQITKFGVTLTGDSENPRYKIEKIEKLNQVLSGDA